MNTGSSIDNIIDIQSLQFKIKEFINKFKNKFSLIILILFAIFFIFSSFYTIAPEEVGVVLRWGKYSRISNPGLNFKIPFGIDTVKKIKTERVYKQEFGFRTIEAGVHTEYDRKNYEEETLMLTGDLNVIDMEFVVQYRIEDPLKYLFKVADVEQAIRDIAEAVSRKITGNKTFDEILVNRVEIAVAAQNELQKILNFYETGIKVITIKLQDVNPPDTVKPAFNEVNEAIQDREQLINKAQETYNGEIPQAKGEAERLIAKAEGYAFERINTAEGDASRFKSILKEYKNYKEVTRRRFYLEAVRTFLPQIKEIYIVDESQKSIMPFMKIGKDMEVSK